MEVITCTVQYLMYDQAVIESLLRNDLEDVRKRGTKKFSQESQVVKSSDVRKAWKERSGVQQKEVMNVEVRLWEERFGPNIKTALRRDTQSETN